MAEKSAGHRGQVLKLKFELTHGGSWMRWPGCPDVPGQLKDSRLLGVEVKSRTGRLRPEQAVFLERIRGAGGVAFVARDCRDVFDNLKLQGGIRQ